MAKGHGPSVKDDKQYEGLRKKGMSKSRAAAISNSPGSSSRGGKSGSSRQQPQQRQRQRWQPGTEEGRRPQGRQEVELGKAWLLGMATQKQRQAARKNVKKA